jgi:hypothetical protein
MPKFHMYTSAGRLFAKSAVLISRPRGFRALKVLRSAEFGPTCMGELIVMGGVTVPVALTAGETTVGALGGFAPNTVAD